MLKTIGLLNNLAPNLFKANGNIFNGDVYSDKIDKTAKNTFKCKNFKKKKFLNLIYA